MLHKRRREDDQNQHGGGGRGKRSRWNRQHLYLVLDDWDKGFSVHKIDADSFVSCSGSDSDDDDDDHQGVIARHLPEPPALRLESHDGHDEADTDMAFSAMGTKIFVLMNGRCGLIYDADTAVLAVGAGAHAAPAQMPCGFGISVHVGDVLFLLTYRFFDDHGQHSFEAMSWAPTAAAAAAALDLDTTKGAWSWNTLPAPPPTFTTRQCVVSHAVHPDGHTIFMTTANRDTPSAPLATYSFNTKEATWRWHGECALPFLEQGHFDAELNAWIGLRQDGYICSCQAVSADFFSMPPLRKHFAYIDPNMYLDCQTTKEKLFRKDPKRYMRASLTSMGSGRFCLVECVASKRGRKLPLFGNYDGCVLHMTIFGLKYNDKGELQTTDDRCTRSFIVSRHISHFAPFAFWM
jgi:hypothetical protein